MYRKNTDGFVEVSWEEPILHVKVVNLLRKFKKARKTYEDMRYCMN